METAKYPGGCIMKLYVFHSLFIEVFQDNIENYFITKKFSNMYDNAPKS